MEEQPACNSTYTLERICMRTSRRRAERRSCLWYEWPSQRIRRKTGRQCDGRVSSNNTKNPRIDATVTNVGQRRAGLRDSPSPACLRPSAHVPGVAQRIASGLWPHAQAVRLFPDGNAMGESPRRRIEYVDLAIVSA